MAHDDAPARRVRDEVAAFLSPARGLDAATRAAVELERSVVNSRRAQALLPALLLVHVGCIVFFWPHGATGDERAWRLGIVRVHAIIAVVAVALLIAARASPDAAWARAIKARLGELMVIGYLTVGAAISLNSYTARFTLMPFAICAFTTAAAIHTRARLTALAYALPAAALVASIIALEPGAAARDGLVANTIVVALLAFVVSRAVDSGMVRDVLARRAIDALNQDLERRVDRQVAEIVARAGEIEQLNQLLNAQVRDRSRELGAALRQLAASQLGEALVEPGTVLGDRVEIERPLGVGGMGVVYAGRDRVSDAAVAVKVIQTDERGVDVLYRFLDEAGAAASVIHPAIVRVLHVDVTASGHLYQVLELVDGESLEARLDRDGALPLRTTLRLGEVIADALAAAHQAGVVHRDVKPSNIMLTAAPPGAKLLDFGLAKLRGRLDPRRTSLGVIIGTPAFLAPEQVTQPDGVTAAIDVYALGCTLHTCLTGAPPFAATTPEQWLAAHVHAAAPDLTEQLPDLDREVAAVIARCLAKDPAVRPTAAALSATLRARADAAAAPPLAEQERERSELDTVEYTAQRVRARPGEIALPARPLEVAASDDSHTTRNVRTPQPDSSPGR